MVGVLVSTDRALTADAHAGESTAILAVIGPHGVAGISVGDSEAWAVGARIDRLTEAQARARLGTGVARPTLFHRKTMEGRLIVATDGLFMNARPKAITTVCDGDTRDIAARLVELPRLRSGAYPDDVAVVVVAATSA